LISLHALIVFFSPQTLNIIGYINHRKVIILVDSGSTHNFICCCIFQKLKCYICVVKKIQIMISNGDSMKCGGLCENVHPEIGQNHLKSHIFSIFMGDCETVLSVEWLHTLSPILMDFKELTMQFQQGEHQY
jgi:hypothetical protein